MILSILNDLLQWSILTCLLNIHLPPRFCIPKREIENGSPPQIVVKTASPTFLSHLLQWNTLTSLLSIHLPRRFCIPKAKIGNRSPAQTVVKTYRKRIVTVAFRQTAGGGLHDPVYLKRPFTSEHLNWTFKRSFAAKLQQPKPLSTRVKNISLAWIFGQLQGVVRAPSHLKLSFASKTNEAHHQVS